MLDTYELQIWDLENIIKDIKDDLDIINIYVKEWNLQNLNREDLVEKIYKPMQSLPIHYILIQNLRNGSKRQ